MEKGLVIAIDGPAGAGKSTVARIVAQKLGYTYIDTGAMYRAVAWKALQLGEPVEENTLARIVAEINICLRYEDGRTSVAVDGYDVTETIRTPAVTALVSRVAEAASVRARLLKLQQEMAREGAVVMDGRDICAHVLPDADVKLFLTASIEERAARRGKELRAKGYDVDLELLKAEIAARDKTDSKREIAPLVQAADATLLDTTGMTIEMVVDAILKQCGREKHAV